MLFRRTRTSSCLVKPCGFAHRWCNARSGVNIALAHAGISVGIFNSIIKIKRKDDYMALHFVLMLVGIVWMAVALIVTRGNKWEFAIAAPGSALFILGLTLWVHPGLYYYFDELIQRI